MEAAIQIDHSILLVGNIPFLLESDGSLVVESVILHCVLHCWVLSSAPVCGPLPLVSGLDVLVQG